MSSAMATPFKTFFFSGGDLNVFGEFVGNHLDMAVGGITNLHGVDVKANELAALALIDLNHGDLPSAIELYGRALAQDYSQVDWRLNLARALAKNGKLDEALHEVRICLRLRPHHAEATRLLEDLSGRAEDARAKGTL